MNFKLTSEQWQWFFNDIDNTFKNKSETIKNDIMWSMATDNILQTNKGNIPVTYRKGEDKITITIGHVTYGFNPWSLMSKTTMS